MSENYISRFRREYLAGELLESEMLENPHLQFLEWLQDAERSGIKDPTAMTLATVDAFGRPSVRVVLLKEARVDGLVFLTNYNSRKAMDLANNPQAAVVFFWQDLDRQLRLEGSIKKIHPSDSDTLFNARPLESRIASVISNQSELISGRDELEIKYEKSLGHAQKHPVDRPEHWGGYILQPDSYEFWQGRENRLNDRILYKKTGQLWQMQRLAP